MLPAKSFATNEGSNALLTINNSTSPIWRTVRAVVVEIVLCRDFKTLFCCLDVGVDDRCTAGRCRRLCT